MQAVPFLLEDRLKERGAYYHKVCAATACIPKLSITLWRGEAQQANAYLNCMQRQPAEFMVFSAAAHPPIVWWA